MSMAHDPDALSFDGIDLEILDIFLEESRDLMDSCEAQLAALSEQPDANGVAALQRTLHTLKGGARMSGISPVGDLAHGIETFLEATVHRRKLLTDEQIDTLRTGMDTLRDLLDLAAQQIMGKTPKALIDTFEAMASGRGTMAGTTSLHVPQDSPAPHAREALERDLGGSVDGRPVDGRPLDLGAEEDKTKTSQSGDRGMDTPTASEAAVFADLMTLSSMGADNAQDDELPLGAQAEAGPRMDDAEPASEMLTGGEPAHHAAEAQPHAAEVALDGQHTDAEQAHAAEDDVLAADADTFSEAAGFLDPGVDTPARVDAYREAPALDPVDSKPTKRGVAVQDQVRVRAEVLDLLVNRADEMAVHRAHLEQQLTTLRTAIAELGRTHIRMRDQLRRLDQETEAQIVSRYQRERAAGDAGFDPLELDQVSSLQQLSRALTESSDDISGLGDVLDGVARQYEVLLGQQARVGSELHDGLMKTRMLPFDKLAPRLSRTLRQAARETHKEARLDLVGADGELDRQVLERIGAPLEHMIRNSVVHGLELPRDRRKANKPEEGTLRIAFQHEGPDIVIQVSDDGAGLNRVAIRERAVARGLLAEDAVISDRALDEMIFAAGFSTAKQVDQLAGRGVGMDVVRNEVRHLGGTIEIQSVAGQGTLFTLRLPQKVAVVQAVVVRSGELELAVPTTAIIGVGQLRDPKAHVYSYAGVDYPLYSLRTLAGMAAAAEDEANGEVLLVRSGELVAAVRVDQVMATREVVVKAVGTQLASIPGIYGASIDQGGNVILIVDVAPLVRHHLTHPAAPNTPAVKAPETRPPLVMVVDDSITMRKITGRVLERHKFEVKTARDGIDALEQMESVRPDLMLLDVEMPRMDGYELAKRMAADPRLVDIPIIMITSRTGGKHRQRAMDLGVRQYLGKPYQETELLRNVYQLLNLPSGHLDTEGTSA
jgi:chemosensory pili system protein ChpA (sensor histidine kinase/response regulator)